MEGQSYSFIETIEEDVWQLVPGQDGSFYTVSWEPDCPNDFITIRYFNEMGEIVNSFKSPPYIGSFNSIDAVTNSANNIVLYLRIGDINHLLYEFDSLGNLIWNNNLQFPNPILKFTKIILSPTGYYLLGNTYTTIWTDSAQAVITKLSPTGKHQWTKSYRMNNSTSASTHFNDILYENDNLICVGRYYYTNEVIGQPPLRPIVSRLDTAGNLLQSFYYMVDSSFMGFDKYEFMQIDKTDIGNYYLVGNNVGNEHALFKMDGNFNIEWINERLSGRATAMCAGYDDDVFISPATNYQNFVMQFNPSGQVIANHVTKNPSSGISFGSGQITHLKRYACGFLFSNQDKMIGHTDKNLSNCLDSSITNYGNYYPVTNFYRNSTSLESGEINSPNEYISTSGYSPHYSVAVSHCSSTYTCNVSSIILNEEKNGIKIFPNPANEILNITFPDNYTDTKFLLYDINGKIIKNVSYTNSDNLSIDLSDISKGIYFLKLIYNKSTVVRKVVVN